MTLQSKEEVFISVLPPPLPLPVPANDTLPVTNAITTTNAVSAFFIKLSFELGFAALGCLNEIKVKAGVLTAY
jgi:hypothetical protein